MTRFDLSVTRWVKALTNDRVYYRMAYTDVLKVLITVTAVNI